MRYYMILQLKGLKNYELDYHKVQYHLKPIFRDKLEARGLRCGSIFTLRLPCIK